MDPNVCCKIRMIFFAAMDLELTSMLVASAKLGLSDDDEESTPYSKAKSHNICAGTKSIHAWTSFLLRLCRDQYV